MSIKVGPNSPQAPVTPGTSGPGGPAPTTTTKPASPSKPAAAQTHASNDQYARHTAPVAMQREATGPKQALTEPERRATNRTSDNPVYKSSTRHALAAILGNSASHQQLARAFDAAFA